MRFAGILSFSFFTLLAGSELTWAQDHRTTYPQIDSVIFMENGEETVKYIPRTIDPETIEVPQEEILQPNLNQSSFDIHMAESNPVTLNDLSQYEVGTIPIQNITSPTGAKCYTIPIQVSPGYHLTPNISIMYNSQSDNGVAGYGWSVSGLSSIQVRAKSSYYDGYAQNILYTDPNATYTLDGEPIVKSENLIAGYELATAKGNIQIHKYQNSYATPAYFNVLYPDGSKSVFGFKSNYDSQVSYPITEYEDIEGNRMTFEYVQVDNVYYISRINYGNGAVIRFIYSNYTRQDASPYRSAVAGRLTTFNKKLLKQISVEDGDTVLCTYSLTHKFKDGVNLLKQIDLSSNSKSLPPLKFTYGIENEKPELQPAFKETAATAYASAYVKSEDLSLVYKKGRMLPKFIGDGMIVLPNLPNYGPIQKKGAYYKYGSLYAPSTKILINRSGYYSSRQDFVYVGNGFQTAEIADIDGDGIDELIKVNNSCSRKEITDYTVTIYSYDIEEKLDSTSFGFSINDGTFNNRFNNPARSEYYFGNFLGDGRVQMLVVTRKLSKFALIDLGGKRELCEETLFTRTDGDEQYMFTANISSAGTTEFCYISPDNLQVYKFSSNSSSFNRSGLYTSLSQRKIAQSMILSSDVKCISVPVDINGDGYTDIVSYPQAAGKEVSVTSNVLNISYFDGTGFTTETNRIINRNVADYIMLLDVDSDGLPDILNLQNDSLYLNINRSGQFYKSSDYVGIKVDSSTDLVPVDKSLWGRSGELTAVRKHDVMLYKYSIQHNIRRKMTEMIDSFGNHEYNEYVNIMIPNAFSSFETKRGNADGYISRPVPLDVLSRCTVLSANNDLNAFYEYYYVNATYNMNGIGFCGFETVRTDESISQKSSLQTFAVKKFGAPLKNIISSLDGKTTYSSASNIYDSHSTTYGKLNPRVTMTISSNSILGKTNIERFTYDKYSFSTQIITQSGTAGGPTLNRTVRYKYSHSISADSFVLGKTISETSDTDMDNKSDSVWRVYNLYTYESKGHPISKVTFVGEVKNGQSSESAAGVHRISKTNWTYDSHWNVASERITPYTSAASVVESYKYDEFGRFLISSTDKIGRITSYCDYSIWGKPSVKTDDNGNVTSYQYDDWGNLLQTTYPDGSQIASFRSWGGERLFTTVTTGTGIPRKESHYDSNGLEVRTIVQRFDNSSQIIDREYDSRKRLIRESLPYKGASALHWTGYKYDDNDRLISRSEPSGKKSTWTYKGSTVTSSIDGIISTRTTDASGNAICVSDPGGTINYTYRDDGQIIEITVADSIVTRLSYDEYGRRTCIEDPYAGRQTDSYVWNTDGTSVFVHTNSHGQTETHRDIFGRETFVSGSDGDIFTYTYDDKGRLSLISSNNGCAKEYYYDNYDRVIKKKESVPDGKFLESSYRYRIGGQIDSIRYLSNRGYLATECYQYTNGYNTGIRLSSGRVIWSLSEENQLGQPTETYTDGIRREFGYDDFGYPTYRRMSDDFTIQNETYNFDPLTRNLIGRKESANAKEEIFTYDNLNRLTSVNGQTISYDALGNIIHKNVEVPTRRITYSCFDRPTIITQGDNTVELIYDEAGKRVKMVEKSGGMTNRTCWYITDKYEQIQYEGGAIREILYLGGDAYSAPMMMCDGYDTWQIGRDYFGSIKQIVAPDGALSDNNSFDPWGRMRNPVSLEVYPSGKEPSLFISRGFTGHEHLQKFGIINMNARLYDPIHGKFLSYDPYVQLPDFTQNYNRFAYALNNPLKYTDKDGNTFLGVMLAIGVTTGFLYGIGNLMAHSIRGENLGHGKWSKYLFSGFLAGFAVGAFTGGIGIGVVSFFNSLNFFTSAANGIFNHNDNWFKNFYTSAFGNFYLDENRSFGEEIADGISRYTWEFYQQFLGYAWTSIRNAYSDRVDLWGGAVFTTHYIDSGYDGVTLGNFINVNYNPNDDLKKYKKIDAYGSFDQFMKNKNPIITDLYMHEYGHTIQSKKWGISYIPIPAFLSLISVTFDLKNHSDYWTEVQADSYSYDYFNKNEIPFL